MKLKLKYTTNDIGLNGCEGRNAYLYTDGPNLVIVVSEVARVSIRSPVLMWSLEGARKVNTLTIEGFARKVPGGDPWREIRIQLV